ncbi:uncharacterized protein LOC135613935 [Musa acuminata AAA Group]|uniref:uncharacterized protein LOC135613935 n=1 Tax=Musa acuminata AAA Group TaxID=214697 RepID=UPI0031D05668
MVDTSATHNFIADREPKRLGLILEKNLRGMKAVNSEAKQISGLAKGVPIKIGTWNEGTNMMAMPLDDFQLEPLDEKAIHELAVVANVLKEFIDVIPLELPKTLLPHRGVDHHIELEPRVKPPTRPPYRMPPPKLAELRKQLDELLSGGLIHSSKAPFGASVLSQKKQDGSL